MYNGNGDRFAEWAVGVLCAAEEHRRIHLDGDDRALHGVVTLAYHPEYRGAGCGGATCPREELKYWLFRS